MLHQELPSNESTPLDRWGAWLVPMVAAAAGLTAAIMLLMLGQTIGAGIAFIAGITVAGVLARRGSGAAAALEPLAAGPDYSLVGAALGLCEDPVALTDDAGALLVVNP